MDIRTVPLSMLNHAAYNPRRDLQPGDPEYERLKKALVEFDYVDPIVWNQRTGNIVGGHQRAKILAELGHTEVTVSVVDLSDEKEKALNLALNKTGGDWDRDKLKDLLEELDTGAFDIEITGFGLDELEKMMTASTPDDLSDRAVEAYEVIIRCENESEQERLYNRLMGEGYDCRVSTL